MKLGLLAAAFCAVVAGSAIAAEQTTPYLNKGNQELALSGTVEVLDFDEIDFDIDVSYGYFIKDGWEIGGRVLGADLGGVERFDFSFFTEYNFRRETNIVPFIGTSFGFATVSFDDGSFDADSSFRSNDDTATVFGIQTGIKWFVRPYMAISTSIAFNVSSDDIYAADEELEDNLTRFRLGLRYYF